MNQSGRRGSDKTGSCHRDNSSSQASQLLGKENQTKDIEVVERVNCTGRAKSQGLIGNYNFTGSDWGGKFVGVSKNRWCKTYLELPSDSPIVETFSRLGSLTSEECTLQDNNMLHETIRLIETFVSLVYKAEGSFTLPDFRWHLFKTKNLESENLPPTRATLLVHIQRTNYVCRIHKLHDTTHPILPALTERDCN